MPPEPRSSQHQRRRKISLACEPCRERKSRCDGAKPICSTCRRRSLQLHQCVYTVENARTASNEAYIQALHDRIQRLERACTENGIPTPPLDSVPESFRGESPSIPDPRRGLAAADPGGPALASGRPRQVFSSLSPPPPPPPRGSKPKVRTASLSNILSPAASGGPGAGLTSESLDATESATTITGMGTVSAEHVDVSRAFDEATNEFYGSSSAASFMKEAYKGVITPRSRTSGPRLQGGEGGEEEEAEEEEMRASTGLVLPPPPFRFDSSRHPAPPQGPSVLVGMGGLIRTEAATKFVLPPRSLADYLLGKFFERVYWLYPFFHKGTFMKGYESLWRSSKENSEAEAEARAQGQIGSGPGLGLGSGPGADAGSIVFHAALNTIFAIGCQFSDFAGGAKEKVAAVETFFNRGKSFVGLDLIDMGNLGVVQSLLLMTLFLQGTPFPSRCWNSVGVACRLAQGLGLHTESGRGSGRSGLEREIRRRTWHGCVVLDMIVSMTYGRPTMTAHLHGLNLPSTLELDEEAEEEEQGGTNGRSLGQEIPSKICFYVEYIRQCRILGEILNSIYHSSSHGGPNPGDDSFRSHGLDAILELDAKLSRYEDELNPIMSWRTPSDIGGLSEGRRNIIVTQRAVLHGSFLYLRLMLHRPILTQLCSTTESKSSQERNSPIKAGFGGANRILYTSFAAECAKICLGAAMDLIDLVHSTYQTNNTGGWWWDALYAFTGGLAVIVGYLSPSLLASLDRHRLERSWMMCQEILGHFASFSISAHRSLKLLQKVHGDVMSHVSGRAAEDKARESQRQAPGGITVTHSHTHTHTHVEGHNNSIMHRGEEAGGAVSSSVVHGQLATLDLANFQWQFPQDGGGGELDMMGASSLFPWDPSMDFFAGGLQAVEFMP